MSNLPTDWGSGETLTAALLAASQCINPGVNTVPPPAAPDTSLISQFEQHPQPSSSIRKSIEAAGCDTSNCSFQPLATKFRLQEGF
jgi:hypothetical protein